MNTRIYLTAFLLAALLLSAVAKEKDSKPRGPITVSPPINAVAKDHLIKGPAPKGMDWDPVKAVAKIKSEGDGKWPADMDLGSSRGGKRRSTKSVPSPSLNGYKSITIGVAGKVKSTAQHFPNEGHENAFDNSRNKWCAKVETPSVEYHFPDGKNKPIIAYAVESANDAPARDPKEWRFSGSMDGREWTTIDEQKDAKFPGRYYTKIIKLKKAVNYKSYRFEVLANRGDDIFQVAEIYLLEKGKATAPSKPLGKAEIDKLFKIADDSSGYEPMVKPDFSNVTMRKGGWTFKGEELSPGKGMKDIWTQKTYGDFVIDLEVRCDASNTNSGIFLRCPDIKQWLHTAIEVQINRKNEGPRHISGAIFDVKAPTKNAIKPVGEWNHYTVIAKDNNILVRINGEIVNVVDLNKWTTPGRNPDGSKNKFKYAYAKMSRVGHIGLQEHGQPVTFRNVRIKKL